MFEGRKDLMAQLASSFLLKALYDRRRQLLELNISKLIIAKLDQNSLLSPENTMADGGVLVLKNYPLFTGKNLGVFTNNF